MILSYRAAREVSITGAEFETDGINALLAREAKVWSCGRQLPRRRRRRFLRRERELVLDDWKIDGVKGSGAERVRFGETGGLEICFIGVEGGVLNAGAV